MHFMLTWSMLLCGVCLGNDKRHSALLWHCGISTILMLQMSGFTYLLKVQFYSGRIAGGQCHLNVLEEKSNVAQTFRQSRLNINSCLDASGKALVVKFLL